MVHPYSAYNYDTEWPCYASKTHSYALFHAFQADLRSLHLGNPAIQLLDIIQLLHEKRPYNDIFQKVIFDKWKKSVKQEEPCFYWPIHDIDCTIVNGLQPLSFEHIHHFFPEGYPPLFHKPLLYIHLLYQHIGGQCIHDSFLWELYDDVSKTYAHLGMYSTAWQCIQTPERYNPLQEESILL